MSRAGTRELARRAGVQSGEDPSMPPRDVREALDAFVQSVVAVTGGDTFLPDQLGDAASAAFEAVGEDALAHDDEYRGLVAEAAYARDPDLASRKADAFKRVTREKEMEALRDAMGPIDTGAFGVFRERAVALAALARRRRGEGSRETETSREGEKKPATVSPDDANASREYGADVAFVAPGTGHAANAAEEARGAETRRRDRVSAFGDSAASAMRASLAEAASVETERAASIAGARVTERAEKEKQASDGNERRDATASAATEQLSWLKARCLEISGVENWELAAQTVARLALASPDDKSDEVVAAELFDFFGDAGVELIMGAIERRGAMAEALRGRVAAARRRFGDDADDDAESRRARVGGGSGAPSASVTITSALDKKLEKLKKKEARSVGRRLARGEGEPLLEWLESVGLPFGALCEGDWERAEETEKKERAATEDEIFAALRGLGAGGSGGRKVLPPGTTRTTHKGSEEVRVPAAAPAARAERERLVPVAELHDWARPAFAGVSHLNRIQSRIYEAAYRGVENLLVCAPTGAGKTNIAMMTVLREVSRHVDEATGDWAEDSEDFKIVYVAPMKALAAEVTAAFSRRLAPLGLSVRELTGDTQLSKKELDETTMLVTTPEKWDVITRKGGEVSAAATLRLLIIDEVHLLNDDRGPVIETLVARTHRQVETTQSSIRIVGLSATLPNPADVASFLGVTKTVCSCSTRVSDRFR